MKTNIFRNSLIAALTIAMAFIFINCSGNKGIASNPTGVPGSPEAANGKTLANLLEAYNGESNANAKYLKYAEKADSEGYGKVASLFRAAAFAEGIHMKNHAKVIEQMGGVPKSEIKIPEIKSTEENLKAAIEGETYERDTMYADFMAEARRTGNKDALRTFNFAREAEGEHAKMYKDALVNLDKWKGEKTTFYVCPTCGYTTANPDLEKCPVDFTPKEQFAEIN